MFHVSLGVPKGLGRSLGIPVVSGNPNSLGIPWAPLGTSGEPLGLSEDPWGLPGDPQGHSREPCAPTLHLIEFSLICAGFGAL